ncbi:MAG: AAA family ATPase [Burkholderiaceae bacterium]
MTNQEAELGQRIQDYRPLTDRLLGAMGGAIVGQQDLLRHLLVGLFANGHILLEGVPGLAKTRAMLALAQAIGVSYQRVQFTPDLLPADLVGTQIYHPQSGEFRTRKGPIFANVVLADEINRAPAKVQSALLEAMQERQVTIGEETLLLPRPFMVLATMNPLEQDGTFPLPEAQVDRFMLKLTVDYPTRDEELRILEMMAHTQADEPIASVASAVDVLAARELIDSILIDERVKQYIVDLVFATREPAAAGLDIGPYIAYGASPRASIYLALAAKAHAFIEGRAFVLPDDVKAVGMGVLRHRILVTYDAEADDLSAEDLVQQIFDKTSVP